MLLIVLIFPPGNYNNSSCFLRLSPLWICSRHAVATSCLSTPPSEDPRGASLNDEFASASNLYRDELKCHFQIRIDLEVITRTMPLVCFRSVLFCISGDLQALFLFFLCDPSDENWVLSLNDVLQIATLMRRLVMYDPLWKKKQLKPRRQIDNHLIYPSLSHVK